MCSVHIGLQIDGASQLEFVALTEHGREIDALMAACDKSVHAGGFHDSHLSRDAATVGQAEVFWASAKHNGLTVLTFNGMRSIEFEPIVQFNLALPRIDQ